MTEYSRISLLEMVLLDSGCHSLSELSVISKKKRRDIATHIENDIPQETPTLQDYNEVLHYMLHEGPKNSKEDARRCLLNGLR